jgi:putative YpdA family bacillithiol system oxidoreductase
LEVLLENIIIYAFVFSFVGVLIYFYLRRSRTKSKKVQQKRRQAEELGFHEPVSLHPVITPDLCIGSGACVTACPEHDILGVAHGKGITINASRCVGHGACFHACPVQAITLCIGTEKRGVELPHMSQKFETTIPGLFIAGELGGMGLIKNAVEQGKQTVEYLSSKLCRATKAEFDLLIVGAGPAGISASLEATKRKLKFLTLEQSSLGGTVFSFPRAKVIMTSPMDLPLYGKLKLTDTSKTELLELWNDVLKKNNIKINELEKVETIEKQNNLFIIKTNKDHYTANSVLLAIGRRGSPRKLGIPGEEKEKVAYRLLEPEYIQQKIVLVVGGGDSAIETALLLANENNKVTLSYRSDSFSRLKPKNLENINNAISKKKISVLFNTNVVEILDKAVILKANASEEIISLENDLVYIFAGGILPTKFLESIGIKITKKFGEAILQHQ